MKDNFFDNLEDYKENKKIKCVNCGREVKDLEKGCPYCNSLKEYNTENYNVKLENIMRENNFISSVLKSIAWIILGIGCIGGIIIGQQYEENALIVLLEIWVISGIATMLLLSLAEIVQILHDIRFKIWKGKK